MLARNTNVRNLKYESKNSCFFKAICVNYAEILNMFIYLLDIRFIMLYFYLLYFRSF